MTRLDSVETVALVLGNGMAVLIRLPIWDHLLRALLVWDHPP